MSQELLAVASRAYAGPAVFDSSILSAGDFAALVLRLNCTAVVGAPTIALWSKGGDGVAYPVTDPVVLAAAQNVVAAGSQFANAGTTIISGGPRYSGMFMCPLSARMFVRISLAAGETATLSFNVEGMPPASPSP